MFSALETTNKDLGWIKRENYRLVLTIQDLKRLVLHLDNAPGQRSIDCETEGLSTLCHKIVGLSFSPQPGHAYYMPLRHKYFDNFDLPANVDLLQQTLQRYKWTTFNGGFDWKFIKADLGVSIEIEDDVQADMYLIDSDRGPSHNRTKLRLDYLSKELLGIEQLKLEDLLPKDVYDFSLVQEEQDALLYAGGDADCTLRVKDALRKRLADYKLTDLAKLEAKVGVAAARMSLNGIYIDQDHAKSLDLAPELVRLQNKLTDLTGETVNPMSPEQVAKLLFDTLKLPARKDSRSVDDDVLEKLADRHPGIQVIRDYRTLAKIKGAFIDKLKEVAAEDNRLHSEFCSTGTRSGRFAAGGGVGRGGVKLKINGQQLPTPEPGSPNCRKILSASPDHYWVSCDFGQVEYRVLAYVSRDKGLIDGYSKNIDAHTKCASLMLGTPVDRVTRDQRDRGKTLNFSMVYGTTEQGLALKLGIPVKEAAALSVTYFQAIPGVDRLIRETKAFISAKGYVLTEFGRRRNYDFTGCDARRIEALLRSGFNTRIQGTAADINKLAVVKVDAKLPKNFPDRARTLSTIHDELNVEFHKSVPVGEAVRFMAETMAFKAGLKNGWLALPVDIKVGYNFGELVKLPEPEWVNVRTVKDVLELTPTKPAHSGVPQRHVQPAPPEPKRGVHLRPPAVELHIPDNADEATLEAITDVIHSNFGVYAVFVNQGHEQFLCQGVTVNPSPKFLELVNKLGVRVNLHKPSQSKTFNPGSLSF